MTTTPRLSDAARLMIAIGKKTCSDLVAWLDAERNYHEQIDVHPWIGTFWYVVIRDARIKKYPEDALLGFTVDIATDSIFWSNDKRHADKGYTSGGNVFCRSERWWRKLKAKYPEAKSDRHGPGNVHDYRKRRGA